MNQHEKARAWRKQMGLSQTELGKLIGCSIQTVFNMEQGHLPNGQPIDAMAWTRYRMACAGLAAGQQAFDWQPVPFVPVGLSLPLPEPLPASSEAEPPEPSAVPSAVPLPPQKARRGPQA